MARQVWRDAGEWLKRYDQAQRENPPRGLNRARGEPRPLWLSPQQAANEAGCTLGHLQALLADGRVASAVKVEGGWVIPCGAVRELRDLVRHG